MTRWRRTGNVSRMSSYKEALEITSELLLRRATGGAGRAGPGGREIRATDRIQEDLGLSLAVMELASDVESRFGVSIPSEMFDRIQTVEDLARAVLALEGLAGQQPA
jgi:acyl carrier protein